MVQLKWLTKKFNLFVLKIRVVLGNFPAVNLPPWWAVPVIWRLPPYFRYYRLRQSPYRRKMKNRLPPTNYRGIALPPKKHRHNLVYRFRPKNTAKSRYRQKVPTLGTAKKVPPTLDTAQKIPPTLDTAQSMLVDLTL